MKLIKKFNSILSAVENSIIFVLVLFMIVLSFSQVVIRAIFCGVVTWADICLWHIVFWVGFIGASLATQQGRHITVDVITKFFSPTWKAAADVLTSSVSFAFGIVFIVSSIDFVKSEYQAHDIAFLGIPFWVIQLIIPIGFGLISLRFFIKAAEDVSYLLSHFKGSS